MNFTKAFAVFMQIDSKEFTEDEKYEAIQQVLDAATINSITKKQVLNVEEIKKELVNEEMSFTDLDNFMMESGYYSVFDDGATENIKQDKNVVYTATDSNECEVQIFFEITTDNGEDEAEEAFYLKVTDVQEF